jgi:hypothetical protein
MKIIDGLPDAGRTLTAATGGHPNWQAVQPWRVEAPTPI